CTDIKEFISKMDEIVKAKEVEWHGKKITFGDEENIKNIEAFLQENTKFWTNSQNPAVGTKLLELSVRIKKEIPEAKALADQYEEIAINSNLPDEMILNILNSIPNELSFYNKGNMLNFEETMRDFNTTKKVSKKWSGLTDIAKTNFVNRRELPSSISSKAELMRFVYKSGKQLKNFSNDCLMELRLEHKDYLKVFEACPNLTHVSLNGVTIETLQELCNKWPHLSYLSLNNCEITKLPDNLPPNLNELEIHACPALRTYSLPANLEKLLIRDDWMGGGRSPFQLTQLPSKLKELKVSVKDIQLPKNLPDTLTSIYIFVIPDKKEVTLQRIRTIQEQLDDYQKRHPKCDINLENNRRY
ncbi:MAG: hypothetical protein LLG04_12995, partial [Parachlamydia sp.]|nr:hypothetical protein [Parachlamydia sp.]